MATTPLHDQEFEERLADLDRRLRSVEAAVGPLGGRGHRRPSIEVSSVPSVPSRVLPVVPGPGETCRERPVRESRRPGASISDVVGGHVLAWIGGVATLLGIALFLTLAISRGWIGIEARVLLAGLGSGGLMGGGIWLHARRGRTEASVVLVAVSVAGMLATLLVASHAYGLISPQFAVAGSIFTGALATTLAIRWAGRAIAALGLLGGLISPVLVGAPVDGLTVAILGVSAACATWTAVRQRWNWLALAVALTCAPQWGRFILDGEPVAVELAALAWFGGLGLAGALGIRYERSDERIKASAAALLTFSGVLVAVLGAVALRHTASGHGPELWLAVLALVHVAAGTLRLTHISVPIALRRLSMVFGLILADVAFGLSSSGIALTAGWSATALAFAAASRRTFDRDSDRRLVELGVGAHVALALVRALFDAPPSALASGTPQLLPLLSVAILAAGCLSCGQLMNARARPFTLALDALGLATTAYLTAQALSGSALAVAWAMEGLALIQLSTRTADPQARWGAAGFIALAVLHALIIEAPPSGLLTGADSLPAAAETLGAIALATLSAARAQRPAGKWLLAGTAATLLYLGSVAVITVFQPTAGADNALLDLSVRQQGQVLLSACWSLIGLTGLIVGLRKNFGAVRNAALALLLLTVAKVFLYDLSTLTSLYRVISFIALGLLLLASAFAYQRLRPPPLPDMRSVHPTNADQPPN